MYAVVRSGGKQYRVEPGQRFEVERVGAAEGDTLELAAILVVDGSTVLATPSQLNDVAVRARVVGETKGDKIHGFTYKPKTNQRRRWGHRQIHSVLEITEIRAGDKTETAPEPTREAAPEKASPAKRTPAKRTPAKAGPTKATVAKAAPAKRTAAKRGTPTAKKTAGKKSTTPRKTTKPKAKEQ
ncbi:MAG: 50S ribosomal protein L21 [Actinobacteria bacterium]|nr:MAG: 50S ribosomal protein L21 [Actinomycetota bacterium]